MKVIKRDKTEEVFRQEKLLNAVTKAFESCGGEIPSDIAETVGKLYDETADQTVTVEEIQDRIEDLLIHTYPEIAKCYIIYRYNHKLIRERKFRCLNLNKDVYTILPGGIFMIESLMRMNINMDKYKTSQLGQALKKVYRGQIEINDAIKLTENELAAIFESKDAPIELDTDNGFFGDVVGVCPLCGGNVKRTKFGYGCSNFREKDCKFSFGAYILGRSISIANAKMLLETGKTSKIQGFTSKNGKKFDAFLKLQDGKVVFDF